MIGKPYQKGIELSRRQRYRLLDSMFTVKRADSKARVQVALPMTDIMQTQASNYIERLRKNFFEISGYDCKSQEITHQFYKRMKRAI